MKASHLNRYDCNIFDLIPLHAWDHTSTDKRGVERQDGKRPLHPNWTKRTYPSARIRNEAISEGFNVGVRPKPNQVVVDIDPRNGGTEGWRDLCDDLLLDPKAYDNNTVRTGSGGLHIYFTKPADVPVMDTHPDFPGVEFKSAGRQVVAAGSRHPNGKHYVHLTPDEPMKLPPIPPELLNLITRPQRDGLSSGGQFENEKLAKLLEDLDPTEFADNDTWLKVMMAAHHATGGDGRQEFIDWSTSDPKYSDEAEMIGRRWDSLHEEKNDGFTYKHLNWLLRQSGKSDKQMSVAGGDAADDFADDDLDDEASEPVTKRKSPKEELFGPDTNADDWLEGVKSKSKAKGEFVDDDEEQSEEEANELSALEKINVECGAVLAGGKFRIVTQVADELMPDERKRWVYMADKDFKLFYGNHKVERSKEDLKQMSKGASKNMKLGDAWLEWPQRKLYKGVTFAPGKNLPGFLNLFEGWRWQQGRREGSWSYLKELMQECICDGDGEAYEYLMKWCRFCFQYPGAPAETAVVMIGGKGVGKGTLGNVMAHIAGRHGMSIASPELITGRFNSHLQDLVFLFADEAIRAHDKAAESRLKNMITEPVLAYERKGMDVVSGRNCLHVMQATNEEWAVPATMDERRFFVTKVNTLWQGNRDRFEKLHAELKDNDNAGYKRFLYDMMFPAITDGWHPRDVPTTKALIDQKGRSQTPMSVWLYNMAEEKHYSFPTVPGKANRAFLSDVRESFALHCRNSGINATAMNRGNIRYFIQELKTIVPDLRVLRDSPGEDVGIEVAESDGRAASIQFPTPVQLRAHFEKRSKGPIRWAL